MAGFLQKFVSGLDFWDKDENRRQRQQFAREDEEERKRREAEARRNVFQNTPQPGEVIQPEQKPSQTFDFSQPLQKTAFNTGFNNPILQQAQQTPEQRREQTEKSRKQEILEKLTEANMEDARADATQGESWFGRNVLNRKAIEERAKTLARSRATRDFQEKYGWNKDPVVLDYGKETSRLGKVESERLQKDMEKLNKFEDKMIDVAQVASYVPITGSVLNLGLAGTEKLAKATGNDAYAEDIDNTRSRIDFDMTADEFDDLDTETQQKLRNLQTLGIIVSPLDFLGAAGLAKSGVTSVGKKVFMETAKTQGKKQAIKAATAAMAKTAAKEAAVPFVAGTALSGGAQAYLGGTENIDPFEAAKTGAIVAGTSLLFPTTKQPARSIDPLDDVARNADDVARNIDSVDEAARAASAADDELEAGVRTAASEADDAADDLPGVRKVTETEEGKPAVEVDTGVKSTNAATVPDPASIKALAKADDGTDAGVPIANFKSPVDASQPLTKVNEGVAQVDEALAKLPEQQALELEQAPAKVDTEAEVDANGNPVLKTDQQAARELAEQGIVPERGDSVAQATEADLETAAREAARSEVDLSGAPAPRTRERAAARITDDDLRADVLEAFPEKEALDLDRVQKSAIAELNQTDDAQLVSMFGKDDFAIKSPEAFMKGVEVIRRLERVNTPESDVAIKNVVNALSEFSSESGRNLRTTQVLFDDMPAPMKTQYLEDRLAKAGVDLSDAERTVLSERILLADEATRNLQSLEADAAAVLESLRSGQELTPRVASTVTNLTKQIDEARVQKEILGGEAWRYYQEKLPPAARGTKFADVGRTLMLSAPSGRIFDQISTAATAASDLTARNISSLIGKAVNKFTSPGTVQDTFSSPTRLVKGAREGAERIRGSLAGKDYVEDISGTLQRSTRGDINTGGGPVRRVVRTATEAPTNLTRGIRNDELYRLGMQEAAELGLKGAERRAYADLRGSIPTKQALDAASEAHMQANMLHRNPISKGLNQFARFLDSKGNGLGAVFIRNQVAPFTSWLGGNLHRTLTDKNVAYNVYKIADFARKGDAQGVVDNVARLATNTGQAAALGYGLTEAGILTDTDANGNSYGGLYFHIGDRYIPVAIAGVNSVPIIMGNSVHKGVQAAQDGDNFLDATANASVNGLVNTVQNAGVASVFGGENNLQDTINSLARESQKDPEDRNLNPLLEFGGNVTRQYIPGVGADANAFLDNFTDLNPTREAPKTTITEENPETGRQKKNTWETEVAKTKSRIPFLSQALEREEGSAAKDPIDRITKGNRETSEQVAERQKEMDAAAILKDREERGVPKTDDGIKSQIEDGNWDLAIEGYEWKLERAMEDGEISDETKEDYERDIRRIKVTRDGNFPKDVIKLYDETKLEEWRDLGDSDSDTYDPDMYELLWQYDNALAEADASLYSGDPSKTRYYSKDSKRGGGGKGSKKGPRFATDIAKQSARGYTFSPIKLEKASFAPQESAVPAVERVPNYSRKPKKISVAKGRRI